MEKNMANENDIVIVGAKRTPMSNFGGSLKDLMAWELGEVALKAALAQSKVPVDQFDEVLGGNTRQAGVGPNPVRTAMVRAGIPQQVHAATISAACPSSMKAAIIGAQNILLGDAQVVGLVGMESMSNIPFFIKGIRWQGLRMGDHVINDGWGDSTDPVINSGMGITAENVATRHEISRQEMDVFALGSHQKAAAAQDNGWFDAEITPVEVPGTKKKPGFTFSKDESIRRDTSLEKMAALPTSFKKDGSVTAANSCGLTDGACAAIMMTRKKARELGVKPLFRLVSYASAAVENAYMGEGPGVSVTKALKKAGMTLADMDLYEINEAFAAQVLANVKVLNLDPAKLNIHGGAIALGHPTGCSGLRIMITGYYALKRLNKEFAVCGICGGGGVTCATVIQAES
jgi:acetyl-CoA C-acetyltransferase